MKKLLIVLIFSVLAANASAQYADRSVVDLRGSRVYLNGEKMNGDEVIARTSRAYKAGMGLTISGASLAVIGGTTATLGALTAMGVGLYIPLIGMVGVVGGGDTGTMVDEMMGRPKAMMAVGGYMFLGGAVMLASGIPIMCVNKKKLDRMRLMLVSTSNGVGLAMNF